MRIVGVDPGLLGGLGVLDVDGDRAPLARLLPIPVALLRSGGRGAPRRDYDVLAMATQLRALTVEYLALEPGRTVTVGIERQGARPEQGIASSYRTGVGMGIWLGIVAALGVPYELVQPVTWKRFHGLIGADKRASRLRAQEKFPTLGVIPAKDEGPAEGLLIAAYVAARRPA